MTSNPLSGIKVIELASYVAAPGAARIMSELGAEVIKVENMGGDLWRMSGKAQLKTDDNENPIFDVYNAGKKSICINIKDPSGKELLLRLLQDADVFITNTRARSLTKLGLDPETLTRLFPRLVYGTVDGFGDKGEDANTPGFDNSAFWGRSGFARDIPIKTDDYYPMPVISGVGDSVTGGFLVAGIMAALFRRERTGKGDVVRLSLYGTAIWIMSSMLLRADPRYGQTYPKDNVTGDPLTYNYECADGEWINISVRSYDKDAPLYYSILGIQAEVDKLGDVNRTNYQQFQKQLIPLIRNAFLQKNSDEWMDLMLGADLAVGKLPHMRNVLTDPQAWANGFVEEMINRNGSRSGLACQPIHMASWEKKPAVPAPMAGENTDEILAGLGYDEDEIRRLKDKGAVC